MSGKDKRGMKIMKRHIIHLPHKSLHLPNKTSVHVSHPITKIPITKMRYQLMMMVISS